MKKILFTLLLSVVVISCDKNDDMATISHINAPIEQEIMATSMDADLLVSNLLSAWTNGEIPNAKRGKAALTSKSSDYQVIHAYQSGGESFIAFLDETNDDLCFGEINATAIYLDNSAGDGSEISVESADGTVSTVVNGNFSAFFADPLDVLIKLTDDLLPAAIAELDENNNATFNE